MTFDLSDKPGYREVKILPALNTLKNKRRGAEGAENSQIDNEG